MKADDKVEYEGCESPETYTNFEELCKRFEVLQEVVNEQAEILRENNLIRVEKIQAPYFDDDEVYKRLEGGV